MLVFGLAFSQVPTSGLIGYYPFNGDANDKSGNVLNGTLTSAGSGFPTLTTDRFGKANSAYSFASANSQYIDFGNPSLYQFGNGTSFTLSAWYNSSKTNTQVIMSHGANSYAIYFQPVTNDYFKFSKDLIAHTNYGGNNPIKPSGTWYHVAAVCNVGTGVKLYLNGELVNSTATVFGYTFSYTNNLMVGRASNGMYFDGKIDDIRLYNRGLSPTEINSLYTESECLKTVSVTDTLKITRMTVTGYNSIPQDFGTLKIYPNPTKDILNISISDPNPNYSIKILNNSGSSVYSSNFGTANQQVNLNNLGTNGLYLIQILDSQNKIIDVRKLILE